MTNIIWIRRLNENYDSSGNSGHGDLYHFLELQSEINLNGVSGIFLQSK